MSRKRLRRYIERLMTLQGQSPTRDRLLMKLGAAKHHAGRAAGQVKVTWPKEAFGTASLEFSLDRQRLRQERRRKGHYLLRNNLSARDPAQQWTFFASTSPRSSRPSRRSSTTWRSAPIFHKTEERIEAHILVAYLACCLQGTFKAKLRALASGTTPREVIAKFKTMQMVGQAMSSTDRQLNDISPTPPQALSDDLPPHH